MWTWFLLVILSCIIAVVISCSCRGADASHNAGLHTDWWSDYIYNCVWNVIMFSVLSVLWRCDFIMPFVIQTWLYPVVKYCVFARFIFVSRVIVSSNNSCFVWGVHYNGCLVFCQLKFNICVRCDMAFIEPMHRNKPNFTYLLSYLLTAMSLWHEWVITSRENYGV